MPYTTKEEKEIVRQHVHAYVNTGGSMTIQQYQRLMSWLNGETFRSLAKQEGVTEQAIAHSVKRDLNKVLAFVRSSEKA